MIYRTIIALGCVSLFIGGCNGLVSSVAGTHKLRTFTLKQLEEEGIGDSDYVAITDAWVGDTYQYVPPRAYTRKGSLVYPLYPQDPATLPQDYQVQYVGWSSWTDTTCLKTRSCLESGFQKVQGIVNKTNQIEDALGQNQFAKINWTERPVFIENGRAPISITWNIIMMVTGFGVLFGMEYYFSKKRKKVVGTET